MFTRVKDLLAADDFSRSIDQLKIISRYVPYLVKKGEEGRDNSVHWESESKAELTSIEEKVVWERKMIEEM